jgi:DNA-binding NarL/FixJ family response regulator
MRMTTRILLVDESFEYFASLRDLVNADGQLEIIAFATTGEEALAKAYAFRPDAIVLRLSLGNGGALRLIPLLRAVLPAVSIVVLNAQNAGLSRDLAIRAGADDVVVGSSMTDELVPSIWRTVLAKSGAPISPV